MADSWSCVMTEKGPGLISDEVRNALKMAACKLFRAKQNIMLFEFNSIHGHMETDWETKRINAIAGLFFKAQITLPNFPDYRVNFIMSEADIKRGVALLDSAEPPEDYEWEASIDHFPFDELYRFDNLSYGRA